MLMAPCNDAINYFQFFFILPASYFLLQFSVCRGHNNVLYCKVVCVYQRIVGITYSNLTKERLRHVATDYGRH